MWTRPTATALLVMLALGTAAVRADDPPRKPPEPDPGFLEFLGSVDRLAEVNPDYLSSAPHTDPPAKPPGPSSPPPPPTPPSAPPPRTPTPPNATGANNND
jgi:hypothetical protein